jgi:hypothetical protein
MTPLLDSRNIAIAADFSNSLLAKEVFDWFLPWHSSGFIF